MSARKKSGENWTLGRRYAYEPSDVKVIEPAEEERKRKATHPFGFSRALEPEAVVDDGIWEGMGL